MESKVVWKDGMSFEAHLDGFNFMIDSDEQFGGQGKGPKPKGLTSVSAAGCTAMDVISILKKMEVQLDSFEIVTDSVFADEHPKKYTEMIMKFKFEGPDLPLVKIEKAVSLSRDKYCGVIATLQPSVKITTEIYLNGEKA